MAKQQPPRTADDYANEAAHCLGISRHFLGQIGSITDGHSVAEAAVADAAARAAEVHLRMAEFLTVTAIRRQQTGQ